MKKTIIIILLALLGMTQAIAQEYEYVPFVREGVKWVYSISDYHFFEDYETNPARGDNVIYRTLELKGDTVINSKTYKAMHKYSGDAIDGEHDTIPIFLREEDKIVYGIVPDGKIYDDALVGNFLTGDFDAIRNGEEFLLYDFKDPVAYWRNLGDDDNLIFHLYDDTIAIGGYHVKRYRNEGWENQFMLIEGIGLICGNSYPLCFFMPETTGIHTTEYYGLEKVIENGEIIYPQNYREDRYMPVIREGIKWVNEQVTVHDGDTTFQYYTYVFKGLHPEQDKHHCNYKALFRYDGRHHDIDMDNDSLVAGMRENESIVSFYRNEPLNRVISQGRDMIDFGDDLYEMASYHDMMFCQEYYIMFQREQFLNEDNFIKAEPIMIDGYRCSRLAYINEQGDTLAYIVEGIGFDSRDMGDLLTPFTRRPDPNADYQEWCGLSHVVKDGQIIYKGMRYRPDTHVGIDEVATEQPQRPVDPQYYNLMGQPMGKDVPTTPGIYIHQGKKIVVR